MRAFLGLTLLLLVTFSPQARADAHHPSCKAGDPFGCLEGAPTLPGATLACELGQPRGCLSAAQWMLDARGVRGGAALRFFGKACELGDAVGCFETGKLLTDANAGKLDFPRAFTVLYRSCRQGYGPACSHVGALHFEGNGTPRDATRAAFAFRNGCERQDPQGCLKLGRLLVTPPHAAAAFERGCKLGLEDSCVQQRLLAKKGVKPVAGLAVLLDPMVETEKVLRSLPGGRNPVPFVEVISCPSPGVEPSCATGDLAICQQAADLQQNGGDGPAAYCMKRQACERGDGWACEQLGYAYEGSALPSAPATALGFYEQGCEGGAATACPSAVRLIDTVEATSTANQRATRKLRLSVRGCALDDSGDCSLVYKDLLSTIADPVLAHRAWITLGRWCEKEARSGPACSVVEDRRKAIVLERQCQDGKAAACRAAAGLYPDPAREGALLARACKLGDCESCAAGSKTVEGSRLAEAKASQLRASKVCPAECKAAVAGGPEPKACAFAVRALIELGGVKNERKALAVAEAQCRRGFSCGLLAELYVVARSLTPADEKRVGTVLARACLEKKPGTCQAHAELAQVKPARLLCDQGQVGGCLKLGEQLKLSNVELPQISVAWERACQLGSNIGCVRHWASLRTARSPDTEAIEQSHQKASLACEEGELQTCIELANHLKFRSGEPEAVAELKIVGERVVTALGKECDSGSREACEAAANFLQFKKDLDGETRAKEFLRKACEHGSGARCLELAEQRSREKDYPGAAGFGSKACRHGSSAGCRMVVNLRGELTGALRLEADRALGLACANRVPDACELATDAGVPLRIESPAAPMPITKS